MKAKEKIALAVVTSVGLALVFAVNTWRHSDDTRTPERTLWRAPETTDGLVASINSKYLFMFSGSPCAEGMRFEFDLQDFVIFRPAKRAYECRDGRWQELPWQERGDWRYSYTEGWYGLKR